MSALVQHSTDAAVDEAFARRRCCFFWCQPHREYDTIGAGDEDTPCSVGSWWKRAREWSERAAGPRWKTFVRRFRRHSRPWTKGGNGKYQYDPLSYAMNFDEGKGQDSHFDEDSLWRDFSFRYASVPASCKSSMDLGKSGGPFFD